MTDSKEIGSELPAHKVAATTSACGARRNKDVWQCYAHLPVTQLTASEVMNLVTPGSGDTWAEELRGLWTADRHATLLLLNVAAHEGIQEPIILGPAGRLWDGHRRLAVALALDINVPARAVPAAFTRPRCYDPPWCCLCGPDDRSDHGCCYHGDQLN